MKMKKCIKCKIKKPENETHFYRKREGFDNRCKKCISNKNKETYYNNLERERKRCRDRKRNRTEAQKEISRMFGRRWSKTDNGVWNTYKRNARKRGLIFDIHKEKFVKLINGKCIYCGEEIARGIDRKDNSKGYTIKNCVSCCKICNLMKNAHSEKDFINKIKQIAKYYVPFPSIENLMEYKE